MQLRSDENGVGLSVWPEHDHDGGLKQFLERVPITLLSSVIYPQVRGCLIPGLTSLMIQPRNTVLVPYKKMELERNRLFVACDDEIRVVWPCKNRRDQLSIPDRWYGKEIGFRGVARTLQGGWCKIEFADIVAVNFFPQKNKRRVIFIVTDKDMCYLHLLMAITDILIKNKKTCHRLSKNNKPAQFQYTRT